MGNCLWKSKLSDEEKQTKAKRKKIQEDEKDRLKREKEIDKLEKQLLKANTKKAKCRQFVPSVPEPERPNPLNYGRFHRAK